MALSWNEIKDRAMRDYLLKYTGLNWEMSLPMLHLSLVRWSAGPLVNQSTCPLVHLSAGPLVHWSTGPQPFPNETRRIEFLFELYDRYTARLFATKKGKKDREG